MLPAEEVFSSRVVAFVVSPIDKNYSPEELHAAFTATLAWLSSGAKISPVEAMLTGTKILEHLPPLGSAPAEAKAHGIHILDGVLGIHPGVMAPETYEHVMMYINSVHPRVVERSLGLISTHAILGRGVSKNIVAAISELKEHKNEGVRTGAIDALSIIPPEQILH